MHKVDENVALADVEGLRRSTPRSLRTISRECFRGTEAGAIGWLDIIANRSGGAERFNRSRRGLARALGLYFAMVLFTILLRAHHQLPEL
jgi:hypothetical protein